MRLYDYNIEMDDVSHQLNISFFHLVYLNATYTIFNKNTM